MQVLDVPSSCEPQRAVERQRCRRRLARPAAASRRFLLCRARHAPRKRRRCSDYFLYWYKSTKTDYAGAQLRGKTTSRASTSMPSPARTSGVLKSTCFTGTKVKILTLQQGQRAHRQGGGFFSVLSLLSRVQMPTPARPACPPTKGTASSAAALGLSLLALPVEK
jgi:hypothetical protein